MSLAFEVDHRAAGGRRQRVGEGFGFQAQLVYIVVERGGRHRKTHATQLGDDAFGPFKRLGAQATTHFRGFIHHGLEAQLHQLVGSHQTGDPGTDNRHFGAMVGRRDATQTGRVLDPVIKGKRKVRAKDGDGFLPSAGWRLVLLMVLDGMLMADLTGDSAGFGPLSIGKDGSQFRQRCVR